MSGRIETIYSRKDKTSKWSQNGSFNVKESGVDIGKDPAEKKAENYAELINKPQINGITLVGNKSLGDLDIQRKLTAGNGISISEDSDTHEMVISEVLPECEIVTLTEIPGTLGWNDLAQVVKRNGLAQVMIRCGTKDGGISTEYTKLFSGFPEPDGTNSISFFGECNGKFYRFYVTKSDEETEWTLTCRSKITESWKEININGIYLCK